MTALAPEISAISNPTTSSPKSISMEMGESLTVNPVVKLMVGVGAVTSSADAGESIGAFVD